MAEEAAASAATEAQGAQEAAQEAAEAVDWQAKYEEMRQHSREWERKAKENREAAGELEKLKEKAEENAQALERAEKAEAELAEARAATERAEAIAGASDETGVPSIVAQYILDPCPPDELAERIRSVMKALPAYPTRTDDGGAAAQTAVKKTAADQFADVVGGII